jgi:SAM-dependent methyltransferase
MPIIDKHGVLPRLSEIDPLVVELGCGNRKRLAGSIGIDRIDYDSVDIVGDVCEVLQQMPEEVVDAAYSHHFFEHVRDLEGLLKQIARVLRMGGHLEIVVPHFANPHYYSDPTHVTHFGLYTLSYFARDPLLKRKVPSYEIAKMFELCAVDYSFKSSPPNYGRHAIKKVLGKCFNCCRYLKEFYEENLCFIFPCYEIRYILKRIA